MLIHNKDDIEFVTEFPCFLGHPVHRNVQKILVLNRENFEVLSEDEIYMGL